MSFQCYCAQFNFIMIVLVLKLLRTYFNIIAKTLTGIPFVEDSLWRIHMLVQRHFLKVLFELRIVRF